MTAGTPKFHTILITGGAGFIGHHLTDALAMDALGPLARSIVVVDSLIEEVHGPDGAFSEELLAKAHCIRGDIRDARVWARVAAEFPQVELIVHLAALTGTGQSMNLIPEYIDVNCGGTAALSSFVLSGGFPALKKLILASSRAVYGEGSYLCEADGEIHYCDLRPMEALMRGAWDPLCPRCERGLSPVLSREDAPARPASVYGISKWTQERLLGATVEMAGIPCTILRFQNVYGPGQSLKNPYTGVLGVFFSSILNGYPIEIFEDGRISRDFVYCTDAAQALKQAALRGGGGIYNIGGGEFIPIERIARAMRDMMRSEVPVTASGRFRAGDIRHNAADISRAARDLAFRPAVSLEEGLSRYLIWATSRAPMTPATFLRSRESYTATPCVTHA
jgi:dTDP-L-rhamnose 4-epimerase